MCKVMYDMAYSLRKRKMDDRSVKNNNGNDTAMAKLVRAKDHKDHSCKKSKKDDIITNTKEKMVSKTKMQKTILDSRPFTTVCRPGLMFELVANLNEVQKNHVRDIGFGGMLSVPLLKNTPWHMMEWFGNKFNPSSSVLAVGVFKDFVVTPEDIFDLFMLPLGGVSIDKNATNESATVLEKEFKERYSFKDRIPWAEMMSTMIALEEGGDDFKIMFVLFAFSTFLTPTANREIDVSILKHIINIEMVRKLDWCDYVLERLRRAVSKFRKGQCKSINACMLILPLLYFHRLKWRGCPEPLDLPLIQHWDAKKIRQRLKAESEADHVGQGDWIGDKFPISRRSEKIDPEEHVYEPDIGQEELHQEPQVSDPKTDDRWVRFRIPPEEKTDSEIYNLAKDDFEARQLIFKRNVNILTASYVQYVQGVVSSTSSKESYATPANSTSAFDPLLTQTFTTDFTKALDSAVYEFLEKNRVEKNMFEKRAGKKFVDEDDDDIPSFDIGISPVNVGNDDVHNPEPISTLRPREDRDQYVEKWPEYGAALYKSRFMKTNAKNVQVFNMKERSFIDYCFYNHPTRMSADNMFSHRGEYYVCLDAFQTMDCRMINSAVVDAWAFMLVKSEIDNLINSGVRPKSFWFDSSHSHFLSKHYEPKKDDDPHDHEASVLGCWKVQMDRLIDMHLINGLSAEQFMAAFFTVDRVFFPICHEFHYVAAVVDCRQRKLFYLDNQLHNTENGDFAKMAKLLVRCFGKFLISMKHPRALEVSSYEFVAPRFKWRNNEGGIDCGVFLMNHMKHFRGKSYECKELSQKLGRKMLRAKYTVEILFSAYNHQHLALEAKVVDFVQKLK